MANLIWEPYPRPLWEPKLRPFNPPRVMVRDRWLKREIDDACAEMKTWPDWMKGPLLRRADAARGETPMTETETPEDRSVLGVECPECHRFVKRNGLGPHRAAHQRHEAHRQRRAATVTAVVRPTVSRRTSVVRLMQAMRVQDVERPCPDVTRELMDRVLKTAKTGGALRIQAKHPVSIYNRLRHLVGLRHPKLKVRYQSNGAHGGKGATEITLWAERRV